MSIETFFRNLCPGENSSIYDTQSDKKISAITGHHFLLLLLS